MRALALTPEKESLGGEWIPIFLGNLRNTANVRYACNKAGISRQAAYQMRERREDFRKDWDVALEDACDVLEFVAMRRALMGSDLLTIFLLKAHRPEKFRDKADINVTLRGDPLDEIAEKLERRVKNDNGSTPTQN